MASLRRKVYVDKRGIKQKSKKWYVRYRDADGINREVPGFRDKEASKQLAAQLEREAELGRAGVRDPFAKHRKQSLSGHVDSFEESLSSAGFSSKYVENTSRWVRKSLKGVQANYFDDITTSAVQKFLGDLAKAGRSPATINNYSSSLQTFLNWGVKDKRFPSNPLAGLNKRRVDVDRRRRRRSLTMEEVGRLVVAAENGRRVDGVPGRVRAMAYVLAAYLGLRKGEIGQLRRGDVDLENNSLRVRASVSKNRREAHLPLHPELVGRLRQYLEQQGSGTSRAPIIPLGRKDTAVMIRADLKAAGIEFETEAGRADFHSLRVSFASNLGRSGVPIQTARELMRHSTVELTARVYTKLDRGDLEGAVCRLPGLESPIPSTPPSLSKSDENQPQVAADRLSKQPKNFPIQFPIADDFSGLSVASRGNTPNLSDVYFSAEKTGNGDDRGVLAGDGDEVEKAPRVGLEPTT